MLSSYTMARGYDTAHPEGRLTCACASAGRSCSLALARPRKKAATGKRAASTAATAQYGTTCGGSCPPLTCQRNV